MKLTFETTDSDEVIVTLDGQTATGRKVFGGFEIDLQHLPDDTVGKIVLEESLGFMNSLLNADECSEGDVWKVTDSDLLDEVYEGFV